MLMGVKSNSHGVVFIEMSNVWHSRYNTLRIAVYRMPFASRPAQPYRNRHFAMRNDLR